MFLVKLHRGLVSQTIMRPVMVVIKDKIFHTISNIVYGFKNISI